MTPTKMLARATLALLGTCSYQAFAASEVEIPQSIGSAIQRSNLSEYTKNGCLDSLQLWSDEQKPPRFVRSNLRAALIFLGDSYLTYNVAFVGTERGKPMLIRQVAEGSDQSHLSSEELSQLVSLVSASKRDKPPSQPDQSLHQVCVVFFTPSEGYFVVHPDNYQESERSTDAAIRFMSHVSPDAP